jgi:TolB-like protein/Flp pilus assembly protein TadD
MAEEYESENNHGPTDKADATAACVFLSYASHDTEIARKVCSSLEASGLRCWMAPRDVTAGAQYADAIVRAINEAGTMVLVLSGSAVASSHVAREVERAASKRKPIIPFRLDAAALNPELEYFLSNSQWIDVPSLGIPAALDKLKEALTNASGSLVETLTNSRPVAHERIRKPAITAALVALAAVAAVGLGLYLWLMSHHAARTAVVADQTDKSIAVLPFTDMSEKKDQEYFADGMAEEILDLLAKIPGLKVIGRTSSFQFKGKSDDLRAIGQRLGANYVVEGSVRKAGARIRVTAQLIDSHSGIHLWSESYDRDYGDILVLQDDIATDIARALQLAVGADDLRPPRRLVSTEAYSLYLHARAALDRLDASMDVAQSELEQALVLDPEFVQAAEVLALMHTEQALNQWVSGPDGWRHAREAAETALRIDPNSARAHAVLGLVSAELEFRWDEADAEIGKALRANPQDSFALDFAARLAMHRARYEEALSRINTALSLDPLNPYAYDTKGTIEYLASDLHEAERSLRRVNELSPTFYGTHMEIGWVLMARGELDAAVKELMAETAKNGKDSGLAAVYHMMGRTVESDAALVRLMNEYYDWPTGVALAHAARGEPDQAIEWLEKAYVARDPDLLLWGPVHPFFASLHDNPRYQALMLKINLPKLPSARR